MLYSGSIFIPEASRIMPRLKEVRPACHRSGANSFRFRLESTFRSHIQVFSLFVLPPLPMDCHTFDKLVRSIECKSFESSRFQVACQAAAVNYFTSEQVAELLTKFTFESTRLDFAKLAYARTWIKTGISS
jgi:hypothetical protein